MNEMNEIKKYIRREAVFIVLFSVFVLSFVINTQLPPSFLRSSLNLSLNAVFILYLCFYFRFNFVFFASIVFICSFICFLVGFVQYLFSPETLVSLPFFLLFLSNLIVCCFSSFILVKEKEIFKDLSLLLAVSYLLYLGCHYAFSIYINEPYRIYANNIFEGQSRNVVSFYLIFFSMLYVLSCRINKIKPALVVLLMVFLFSFLLYGRSGIATCGGIFLLYFWFYLKASSKVLLVVIFSIILFCYFDVFYDFLLKNSKFSIGISSPRLDILYEYLKKFNLKVLIFGGDENDYPIIKRFSGNPHNSFIKLNLNFGGMLLFFSFLVFSILKRSFRKDIFIFMVFVLYLFRVSLDSVAFVTRYTDVLFFVFLFFCFLDEMDMFYDKTEMLSKRLMFKYFSNKNPDETS